MSAEIALDDPVFIRLKRHAELVELLYDFRRIFAKPLHRFFIGEINAAAHGIFIMVFDFIVLSHCVQAGVDAALRHDRLRAFGLHGRYQV